MTATIALVDDDKNILTSVSIALQTEGFLTRLYSDPEAALKALIENPSDLAVFDIKMHRMDGLELLRRLREKSHMTVIFQTSKAEELDEALCRAFGVIKPKKLYGRDYIGIERSTFLIDPKGRVAESWRGVKVAGHADDVLAALQKAAKPK